VDKGTVAGLAVAVNLLAGVEALCCFLFIGGSGQCGFWPGSCVVVFGALWTEKLFGVVTL